MKKLGSKAGKIKMLFLGLNILQTNHAKDVSTVARNAKGERRGKNVKFCKKY
jgi:hypothetical protein